MTLAGVEPDRIRAAIEKARDAGDLRALTAFKEGLEAALEIDPANFVHDPAGWAMAHGVWLWTKPRQILESIRDNRLTAVHAGHGISKSHTGAVAAAWWIETRHKLGTVRVVTTSDTWSQVRGVLWQEINRLHAAANLSGRVTQTEWWLGTDMVGLGRKPADYDPNAIHGFHAEYVLVIIDETAGVPIEIIDAARSLASGDDDRILALGNPDFQGSTFDRICSFDSPWNVIHMDVLESPNFTGENVPPQIARALTGQGYVEEIVAEHGPESPVYYAKVRGRFPADQDDGVVRWSDLVKCKLPPDEPLAQTPVSLGVDVGEGGDQSVVRERRGAMVGRVWRDRQPDTMRVVGLTLRAIEETGATSVAVDATGTGKGVADRLAELKTEGTHNASIIAVKVGRAAKDPTRFANLRAEIWWEVGRELSEQGGWNFSDAQDIDSALADLSAPKYHTDSSGRVVVEKKAETKKRLGRSPDDGDALLLAFHRQPGVSGTSVAQMATARIPLRR